MQGKTPIDLSKQQILIHNNKEKIHQLADTTKTSFLIKLN